MSFARLRPVVVTLLYGFVIASPFSLGAATTIGLALLAIGLAVFAVNPQARRCVPRWVWVGLLGMIVWSAVATAMASPYPIKWEPWVKELWIKLMMVSVATLIVANRVRTDKLMVAYLISASVVACFGIAQHFLGKIPFEDEIPPRKGDLWEIEAFYNHHLTYGGHVAMLFCLAVSRALSTGLRRVRWPQVVLSASSLGLLGLGLLWSYARSAQLGAVAGLAYLALLLPKRARLMALAAIALGVVGVLATPTLRARFTEALDPATESTRLALWESSVHGIADRPLTGFGVGNFGEMLEDYEVEAEYDTRAHAHNDYIMHAVNGGVPMLLFALVFAGALLWITSRRRTGGPLDWIVIGAAAAHVTLIAGGLFQVFQTDDEVEMTLYFVMGCALATLALGRDDTGPGSERPAPH